jgi:3-oxoacyl-[acyl-carrier-protein] synthase II
MKIVISGVAHLSAAGQGVPALRSALTSDTVSQPEIREVTTNDGLKKVPVYLAPDVALPDDLPDAVKRRMARFSRMCFVTTREALDDAFHSGHAEVKARPERVGLVVGSAFGCLDLANLYQRRVILEGQAGASPSLFAASIHNSLAAHASISFGLRGPSSTIATMEQTAIGSLALARQWITRGIVDHVVTVIGDEASDYHSYLSAHSEAPQLGFFDPESDRCTALAGEGLVGLVLSKQSLAHKAYAAIGEISPFRTTPPDAERYQHAAMGFNGQASKMRGWLQGRSSVSHAKLYGSVLTAVAFETLIATLRVAQDGRSTACVQLADNGAQSITLLGAK